MLYQYSSLALSPDANRVVSTGINNDGWITGYYTSNGRFGFLYQDGTYKILTFFGAPILGIPHGISSTGLVAGYYAVNGTDIERGFVWDGLNFTMVDFPGALETWATDVNASLTVVGHYSGGRGFVFSPTTGYASLVVPSASYTEPSAINDAGTIVGYYLSSADQRRHGFIFEGGNYTTVDHPLAASNGTVLAGINNNGAIVGYFRNGAHSYSFIYDRGQFTKLNDDPLWLPTTEAQDINDAGTIVGIYARSGLEGFVATPVARSGSVAIDDAYVMLRGQSLSIDSMTGVLLNDEVVAAASLVSGVAHGRLQLARTGSFTYTPAPDFIGIDSFTYRATETGNDVQVFLHVVPVAVASSTTLSVLALSAEEQIAALYAGLLDRGADRAGFDFWLDQYSKASPVQGLAEPLRNIANAIAGSTEAKSILPFLDQQQQTTDDQIAAFVNSIYDNLFGRQADAAGGEYWKSQIHQALAAGKPVGSIVVDILSGAQNTTTASDITTLMGKVAVSLGFVHEQEERHTVFDPSDVQAAADLLDVVGSDALTVLIGMTTAESLALSLTTMA